VLIRMLPYLLGSTHAVWQGAVSRHFARQQSRSVDDDLYVHPGWLQRHDLRQATVAHLAVNVQSLGILKQRPPRASPFLTFAPDAVTCRR